MSDNQLINSIRENRRLNRLWNKLTVEQKRRVLEIAEGELWHIDEVIEDVLEEV